MSRSRQIKLQKVGVPILILLFLIFLPRTLAFQTNSEQLSVGILLDLLITIPVVYFVLIRKTAIPKFTVVYPFLLGLLVASYIIPLENQDLLSTIKLIAIPIIEIGIVSMIIYKMRSLTISLKGRSEADFYDKLLRSCQEVFPNRVGKLLATEIAVFYYLFAPARKQQKSETEYTYYQKSGIKTMVGVFLGLIAIETIVVHILVADWNEKVAWVLSFLGIYGMIQIIAVLRSMSHRPIAIDYEREVLILRYGFGCQTMLPFSNIKSISKNKKAFLDDKFHVCLSLFDLVDTNNLIIHLHKENILYKIYGIEKKYTSISLFVDERDDFFNSIEQQIVG